MVTATEMTATRTNPTDLTRASTPAPATADTSTAFVRLIGGARKMGEDAVKSRVDRIRKRHPELDDRQVAERFIAEMRRAAGTAGAVTNLGGVLTLPVMIPAGMLASWTFATQTVLGVAYVYGYELTDERLRFDVLAVLAANEVNQIVGKLAVESSKHAANKAVQQHITREVMVTVNKVVPRKLLTKAGERSVTSFTKLAPLVGAPVGYAFESVFIRGVGARAIKWYESDDQTMSDRLDLAA